MPLKLLLFFLFFFPYLLFAQISDSLNTIQELEKFQIVDATALPLYHSLYTKHKADLNTDESLEFIQKGIDASKEFSNDSLLVNFSLERCDILVFSLQEYENALKELNELNAKVDSHSSPQTQASYYTILGITYDSVGESSKAIDAYLKAINIYKLSNDFEGLPNPLRNIAILYTNLGDYENAKKYTSEIFPACSKMEETIGLTWRMNAHHLLGHIFTNQEKQDSTLHHTIEALDIAAKIDTIQDPRVKFCCYRIYLSGVEFFSQEEELEKAGELLKKVESYKIQKGFLYFVALTRYHIGRGKYKAAEEMLQQLPDIEEDLNYSLDVTELKANYYEKIGNFEKAFKEKSKELEIKNDLTKQQRLQYATFANVEYETLKKEEEIKSLKQSEAFEQQKSQLLFFAVLLLISFLLLGLLAYKKIKNQATELQNIYEQRSKLFSNIAHELRTPLALISGPIHQIVHRTSLEEEDRDLLNLAQKSSQDLEDISQQILDLTKSEYGKIQANLVKFNWLDFLQHYLPQYAMQAKTKGLQFEQTIPNEESWVQTDIEKLKIILNNLFQNAFRFSEENGEITFKSSQSQNQISFSIQDAGVGIDEKDLPYIFKRYYQSNHNLGGFGIGLAVCKEYLEAIGGKIDLISQKEKGTTVSVSFPKTIQSDQAIKTQTFSPNPILETSSETITIREEISTKLLIIEDHEGLRSFLQATLSKDYDVHFAKNGREGLEKLDALKPDLVITDWMMPIMDGLQFIEELRKHKYWHDLPVLMLTARSFPIDKLKALQKGVNDYLSKPFEVEVLKVHIENLLNLSINRKDSIDTFDATTSNLQTRDFGSDKQKDQEWILDIETIVYNHIQDFDLNIGLLAEKSNLSKSHFSRKIKTITGMTPLQFINEIRFWEARKLLEEKQETSVKAVVYSVGFKSVKNFSRKFKQRFGVYPKDLLS